VTQRPGFGAGLAAALLAVVIWGVQFPVAKDAFAQIDPFHITAIRYLVGTLALLPLVLWREGLQVLRYEGRFASATLHGLIGMCGSPMLVFWGLAHTRPEHTAIIVSTQPVLTALAEWLVRGRRPTRLRAPGTVRPGAIRGPAPRVRR
jgi:drug/metabolite transporter (DMT)-like permease